MFRCSTGDIGYRASESRRWICTTGTFNDSNFESLDREEDQRIISERHPGTLYLPNWGWKQVPQGGPNNIYSRDLTWKCLMYDNTMHGQWFIFGWKPRDF